MFFCGTDILCMGNFNVSEHVLNKKQAQQTRTTYYVDSDAGKRANPDRSRVYDTRELNLLLLFNPNLISPPDLRLSAHPATHPRMQPVREAPAEAGGSLLSAPRLAFAEDPQLPEHS